MAVNVQGMGDGLVQARGLRKSFGAVEAVRGIDLDVARGESFGFLGPNGAGKSSTMRMIACVSPRSAGALSVLGLDPGLDGLRIRARIGVVPQQDNLDAELSVRENLEVYGRYFGLPRARVRAKAAELLDFAQLVERADEGRNAVRRDEAAADHRPRRWSTTRSCCCSTSRPPGSTRRPGMCCGTRLFRLKREGVTLIVTTHYMDEAEQLCDRLVVMDGGLIVAQGSPGELIAATPPGRCWSCGSPRSCGRRGRHARPARSNGSRCCRTGCCSTPTTVSAPWPSVAAAGLRPMTALVRRSSLEDVFLRLTGRTLVD